MLGKAIVLVIVGIFHFLLAGSVAAFQDGYEDSGIFPSLSITSCVNTFLDLSLKSVEFATFRHPYFLQTCFNCTDIQDL